MTKLSQKKCVPCEGGTPTLKPEEIKQLLAQLKEGWSAFNNIKILKNFTFKDFKEAMNFVNKVADLAEKEGHHPDILISYNKVDITIWTHAIGGLSENDFILAAKIDNI